MRIVIAVGRGVPCLALLLRALDFPIDRPSDLVRSPVNLISVIILESVGKGDVLLVLVYNMLV